MPTMPPVLTGAGLEGSVVIVTGAAQRIGAATACWWGLAWRVAVLVGRREAPLRAVAAEITAAWGQALRGARRPGRPGQPGPDHAGLPGALRPDRRPGQRRGAMVRHMPLGDWDTGCFDEHVATNIRAPFFLVQAALPALRESPIRSVVNVSSSSGTLRRVGQSVYGMTKAALDYLTQTLAGELAPLGVRVNGIAPVPSTLPSTPPGPTTWRRRTAGWAARCRSAGSAPRRKWRCGSPCCSARRPRS